MNVLASRTVKDGALVVPVGAVCKVIGT